MPGKKYENRVCDRSAFDTRPHYNLTHVDTAHCERIGKHPGLLPPAGCITMINVIRFSNVRNQNCGLRRQRSCRLCAEYILFITVQDRNPVNVSLAAG